MIQYNNIHSFTNPAAAEIIREDVNNLTVEAGNGIIINCIARGVPQPFIVWNLAANYQVDHNSLYNDTNGYFYTFSSITIKSASPVDSRNYTCMIANTTCDDDIKITQCHSYFLNVNCEFLR